jgi:hypothetical protein
MVDGEDNNAHPNGHIEGRFVKRAGAIAGVDKRHKRDVFAGLLDGDEILRKRPPGAWRSF